ncbi:MAG TPA: pyruvate dehydrogenase [Planctomycetota bacterium]|jgi:pyruvate dehydrogenase E1 component|nr:pyruvate dehydrogenase [Planctomycetota bacterium]
MTPATLSRPDTALLTRLVERSFAQTMAMIHYANHRDGKRRGDPKVGGHPASCASSIHILGALHFAAREVHDYVCCKPHASPVDHSCHHLMQLFRAEGSANWFSTEESKAIMERLRRFPDFEGQPVFQSYHARSDPDSFHFLPSGSVGIPPVVSVYLALAHRYARDHGFQVPPDAHFWSLIGDSEFREGSLMECLPDVAERQLGNVTWIVDYNRQNLDGTRIPNERGLRGADCDRIERTCRDNGWRVIQVRHGRFREDLFNRPGGVALKRLFEGGLSDYEFQMLLLKGDAAEIRRTCGPGDPDVEKLLAGLSDADVLRAFGDLGGHCIEKLLEAYERARQDTEVPSLIIAHTIKGWGLESAAHPANHSMLPSEEEIHRLLAKNGLSPEDPFALFLAESEEGLYLAERRDRFRAGIEEHLRLRKKNREWVRKSIEKDGGLPDSLGVDTSLFPIAHTQWMWGQLAAKLVRIGTKDEGGPETAVSSAKTLSPEEQRWKTAADMVLTLSPDVGTSTNISPVLDQRIYGPDYQPDVEDELAIHVKHPDLVATDDPWTRHIRFEIAEANCMSCAGAFGKMGHYVGLPFFPMMTVYDFFIKRALDQLYYNLYWGAEFVIVGTPSGVTLSPEGAQHSWKSDIQIPNLITWEPLFAVEMDWILSDALRRQMMDGNEGRRGVLIRAVTRGIQQNLLLDHVRTHASSKAAGSATAPLKPRGAGDEWGDAVDESTLAALPDAELLARVRRDCLLGAYYLVDWRGYAGYEPGDNVVRLFAMGSVATEAIEASRALLARGIFADVIVVSSPELLLGILGEKDGYRHLQEGLAVDADLHAIPAPGSTAGDAELVSIAGRRVPIVAVCDGEAGLLDNIGSIVGVRQVTLAVRKFSKCGRPDQVYAYQHLDAESLVEACGRVLSETALEDLRVPADLLARAAARAKSGRPDWRALWPDATGDAHG